MVGLGTLLFLLSVWYGLCWLFRRDMPKSKWFLRVASVAGVAAIICMEAGWVVSEVGRQPWIVYNLMKVEDAATANTGVWITFVLVDRCSTSGSGSPRCSILRNMSRRFRERGVGEHDVPYGPQRPGPTAGAEHRRRWRGDEHGRRRRAVLSPSPPTPSSAAPTSAPGSGTSSPAVPARGERPREVIDHSIGPVWEANHVWLIFIFVVLWTGFSEAYASITLTLFVPLTLAAFGIVLRGSSFAFRKTVFRTRDRRNFGAAFALSSVLVPYCMGAVAGAIASGRVPAGGQAGDPWTSWVNPTSILGGVLAVVVVAYLAAVYLVWDARRLADAAMVEYFRRRAIAAAVVAGVVALVGIFVLRADARYLFDELTSRALPARHPLGRVRCRIARPPGAPSRTRRTPPGHRRRGQRRHRLGRRPVALHPARPASRCPTPRRPRARSPPSSSPPSAFALIVLPGFILLYVLDQKNLLPEEGAA